MVGMRVAEVLQAARIRNEREIGLEHQAEQVSISSSRPGQRVAQASIERSQLLVRLMGAQGSILWTAGEPRVEQASCSFGQEPKAAQGTWAAAQVV